MGRYIGRNENMENDIKLLATVLAFACISGCTTGTAVVTGQERSQNDPAAVTLYAEPPAHYEVVGIVEAASGVLFFFEKKPQARGFGEK